jgi:hypothetical protein
MSVRPTLLFAFLSASIACWLERQAAARIEYLKAGNRALRTRLGRRRIVFMDAERRTLATLGFAPTSIRVIRSIRSTISIVVGRCARPDFFGLQVDMRKQTPVRLREECESHARDE